MSPTRGLEQWKWRVGPTAGAILWVVWAVVVRPEWTTVLLLLSPFVLLPMGLRLAAGPEVGPDAPALRFLSRATVPLASTAAASFLTAPGWLAALVSVPWLIFTSLIALAGLGRLLSRDKLLHPGVGVDAGLMFVVVGGVWLTISRAGLNPVGFSDAIVQLTAVHFHYAGFALPIVAGVVATHLHRSAMVPLAVIIGVPLTAAGITAGGWLEWFAATAMALAAIATAAMLIRCGIEARGLARSLTVTAGVALTAGMTLAIGWAWTIRFGWDFLGLESMAATHGSLNALGFGLLGLLGLNLMVDATAQTEHRANEVSLHVGRPTTATMDRLLERAIAQEPTNATGLLDRAVPDGFDQKSWHRPVAHDDFEAAAAAITQWRGHRAAGITHRPATPAIAEGTTLALAIPVGPISVTATCRIVRVIDEADRFGFVYSTLPHHPVDGEESFIVARRHDGTVDITVTAMWQPAMLANHLCPPLTRWLQSRAINRYLDGIATFADQPRTVTA